MTHSFEALEKLRSTSVRSDKKGIPVAQRVALEDATAEEAADI
jgi:hypothetical protein